MINKTGLLLVSTLLITVSPLSPASGQQTKEHDAGETTAKIQALTDFHEVIFTLWHTAWPAKDIAMLCALVPEIQRRSDSLQQAQLPGILRDKQKAWSLGVEQLQTIVQEYQRAASPVDSQKLLDAAERLHMQYERLVRITNPVLKELDGFHQCLYILYHHYLPGNNPQKIVSSVKELKERMAVLDKVSLPERLRNRESAFIEARKNLARSVGELDETMAKTDPTQFATKVESMHGDYQALEKVFE